MPICPNCGRAMPNKLIICNDCFERAVGQTSYQEHLSGELVSIFRERPYQGQDFQTASLIILGTDANYSPMLCNSFFSSLFFKRILDYHSDGIVFCEREGIHHPFLLDDYPFNRKKDGVRYHSNFGKLRFKREHAQYISFVELLNIPTIGNTGQDRTLFRSYLDENHLRRIEELIMDRRSRRFILINQKFINELPYIYNQYGIFNQFIEDLGGTPPLPGIAVDYGSTRIYNGYSFSYSITNEYLSNLRNEIIAFLPELA